MPAGVAGHLPRMGRVPASPGAIADRLRLAPIALGAFLHVLPGCGARSELVAPSCAKPERAGPVAPRAFAVKSFPGTAAAAGAVTRDARGDLFLAGELTPGDVYFGGGPRPVSSEAAFIAKFDASGDLLWDRLYAGAYNITQLLLDPEGNLLVAGGATGRVDFEGRPLPPTLNRRFLAKLTPTGDPVWEKKWLGIPVLGGERTFDVDGCGHIVLTGVADAANNQGLGVSGDGVFVAAYEGSGRLSWSRSFGGTSGVTVAIDEEQASIVLDQAGEILLSGRALLGDAGSAVRIDMAPSPQSYLAKLSSTGDLGWIADMGLPSYFGGVDDAGEVLLIRTSAADPTLAQWIAASGQVSSTTALSFGGMPSIDGFYSGAVASSGGFAASSLSRGALSVVEFDRAGTPLWSWSFPRTGVVPDPVVGLDAAGRPLVAGVLHPEANPGASPSLFLAFDASPP
jgi:hypothetical protein